MIRWSN